MLEAIKKHLYKLIKKVFCPERYRTYVSFIVFFIIWELGVRQRLPIIENIPTPTEVFLSIGRYLTSIHYWKSWMASMYRVYGGFLSAQILGIPLGLYIATNKEIFYLIYPIFEILRPVPPLAWVPIAIIFWPTTDSSMMFLTFLGAFYPIVLNIVEGAQSIDNRHLRAAYSLGSSSKDVFRHILLPACMPSIIVGMVIGIGAGWTVVIAAEMISSSPVGLGQLTWRAYVVGEFPGIIIGMASIGFAGFASSGIIRYLSRFMTPWIVTKP